jgi:hypothetical protein
MKRQLSTTQLLLALGWLLIAAACAPFSFAQTPPAPQYYRVQVIKTNPGVTDEWRKFYQAEILTVLKKAGVKRSDVLTTSQGDLREYIIISPLESLAQLDEPNPLVKVLGPEAARALNMKQSRFFSEWRTYISIGRPDLGIAPASTEPAKLAISLRLSVTPGRAAEYEKWVKENAVPAARKTEVKGVLARKVALGDDPNEYLVGFLFDSYTEMGKFQAALTKANAGLKLAPAPPAGVVARTEIRVVRYIPELSIRPEAQKATK